MEKRVYDEVVKVLKEYNDIKPTVIWYDLPDCCWYSWRSVPFPIITDEELMSAKSWLDLPIRKLMGHLRTELGFNLDNHWFNIKLQRKGLI